MKTYILITVVLLSSILLQAQQINYGSMLGHNEDESFIKSRIYILVKSLNESDGKYFNSILTSDALTKNKKNGSVFEQDSRLITIKDVEVKIKDYSALVFIKTETHTSKNEFTIVDDTLKLIKINNHWKFDDLGKFTSLTARTIDNPKSIAMETLEGFNLVTPYISDRTYVPKPQLTSPNIFEINANYTIGELNQKLYQLGSEIDAATYTNSVNPDMTGNTCVFTLDSKWNRIIYSKRGSDEIKSYGDNQNDFHFIQPTAIDVNEYGQVYVVDNYTKKIQKFAYNYANNTLYYNYPLNIPEGTLKSPIDIDYSSNGTAYNQNDDFILVTDAKRKSILKFSLGGNLLEEYKTYNVEGVTYSIGYPTRITTTGDFVQFIDASKNLIISAGMVYTNTLDCLWGKPSKLPSNYRPTDIGVDQSYNIIVSDGIGMIHKFDFYGNYLCSYRNTALPFLDTRRVSNSTFSYPGYSLLDIDVNDRWDYTKGAKRLLPGADAVQLQVIDRGTYFEAACILTDECNYKLEIIKLSNNTVIKTILNNSSWGGEKKTITINKSEMSNGSYKFKVSVLPYHNDLYGSYAVVWKFRETTFSFTAPLTATMSGPSYLSNGQSGTFIVTASGSVPPYTYAWSYYIYCRDPVVASLSLNKDIIVPNAPACGYWINIFNTTNTTTRISDGRSFQMKCVVTDASHNTFTVTKDVSGNLSALMKPGGLDSASVLTSLIEMKTELLDNYPNPFNPSTKINYSVKTDGRVALKIYNTLGEEIRTLVDEIKPAGSYEAEFNASELPSGVYIYRMQSGDYVSSKKMILLK